jgi:hypothetical protein
VYVWRLLTFIAEEEETVAFGQEHGWHYKVLEPCLRFTSAAAEVGAEPAEGALADVFARVVQEGMVRAFVDLEVGGDVLLAELAP